MNRALHYVNLVGVVALAVICVLQWRIDRQLNLRIHQLEKERANRERQMQEQTEKIQGQVADLEKFREHVAKSTGELKAAESNLALARRECAQLSMERDQLKESIASWSKAVTERDEQLVRASEQTQKLNDERNEIVAKFNSLAEKHNGVVEELNKRTGEFNGLVERYNALMQARPR